MFANKPIIGLAGGIGSGKSFIARCFAEAGCYVIDSDKQVKAAYRDPTILQTLRQWWGNERFWKTAKSIALLSPIRFLPIGRSAFGLSNFCTHGLMLHAVGRWPSRLRMIR